MNQEVIDYISGLVVLAISIFAISSLFIGHKSYAKISQGNKSGYLRAPLLIACLGFQISYIFFRIDDFNPDDYIGYIEEQMLPDAEELAGRVSEANKYVYLELCNMVAGSTIILLIFPTKLQMQVFLPLTIIGPTLTLLYPRVGYEPVQYDNYGFYQYYIGHLVSLFSYIYMYQFGYTKIKFNKEFMLRSYLGIFIIMLITQIGNVTHGENFIVHEVTDALNITNKLTQEVHFVIFMLGGGPFLLSLSWLVILFDQPLYSDRGRIRAENETIKTIKLGISNRKAGKSDEYKKISRRKK